MENIRNWWSDLHYTSAQKRSLLIVAGLFLATSSFFILRTSTPSEAITPPALSVDVAAVDIRRRAMDGFVEPARAFTQRR